MDILMIYWNSVWTNSKRDTVSLLADHSGAELRAYRRALHAPAKPARGRAVARLRGRTWTSDRSGPAPATN